MAAEQFLKVPISPLFWSLRDILHRSRPDGPRELEYPIMEGFEDILPDGFGTGERNNTMGSIYQLVGALAIAPNPAIAAIVRREERAGTARLTRSLRASRVLAGLKVLDLGCGQIPSFAIAASALGAEVHTADKKSLPVAVIKQGITSHTVVDIRLPQASLIIRMYSGGEFDYITSNVVGPMPDSKVEYPDDDTLYSLGQELLKPGGFMFNVDRVPLVILQKPN